MWCAFTNAKNVFDPFIVISFTQVDTTRNDGKLLLELLGRAETETEILTVLAAVHGPWALVYFQVSGLARSFCFKTNPRTERDNENWMKSLWFIISHHVNISSIRGREDML